MKVLPFLASGEKPRVLWSSSDCSPRSETGFTIHLHFINTIHVQTSSKRKLFYCLYNFTTLLKFDLKSGNANSSVYGVITS